jgi:hypothetical protein
VSTRPGSANSDTRGSRPPSAVRAAAALVGLQGLVGAGFAGYLVLNSGAGAQGMAAILGEGGIFLLLGVALLAVAGGLFRGRFWARTPAIVVQLLLLPVAYSLLVPSSQILVGAITAVVVLATLLLLLSPPARTWALDLDDSRRRSG